MRAGRAARTLLPLLLVAAVGACADREAEDTATTDETAETIATTAPEPVEPPRATAEAVWAHLQQQDYTTWPMFPGKDELYSGGEPHGMLLTTYVNQQALDALQGAAPGAPDFQPGAILVKENYMPDSTLAAVTVMYKTANFAPEQNDWWFMKRLADGTVEASGRVPGCQGCHGGATETDYIMTPIPAAAGGG